MRRVRFSIATLWKSKKIGKMRQPYQVVSRTNCRNTVGSVGVPVSSLNNSVNGLDEKRPNAAENENEKDMPSNLKARNLEKIHRNEL